MKFVSKRTYITRKTDWKIGDVARCVEPLVSPKGRIDKDSKFKILAIFHNEKDSDQDKFVLEGMEYEPDRYNLDWYFRKEYVNVS